MGSLSVLTQQVEELDLLHAEAQVRKAYLQIDAIARVKLALERGIRPVADDIRIVQSFMGSRTDQDRYGK